MPGVAQEKPLPPPLSALLHKVITDDHKTSIFQTMMSFTELPSPPYHLLSVTTKPAPELLGLPSHTIWQGWEKHFASFYCSEASEAPIVFHAVTHPFSFDIGGLLQAPNSTIFTKKPGSDWASLPQEKFKTSFCINFPKSTNASCFSMIPFRIRASFIKFSCFQSWP